MRDWTGGCFKVETGRLLVLDQTKLPDVENWVLADTPDDMITLILDLRCNAPPPASVPRVALVK